MSELAYMKDSVASIRKRMKAAEEKSGNKEVTLLAAIKYTDTEHILELARLGVKDVGENRVQQLLERYEAMRDAGLNIHFIGTLQTNKVKYIIDKVCMIHSLGSVGLAREIERQAAKHDLVMPVLVEINSGEEESKSGFLPEEAEAFCATMGDYPHLKLAGFMTMAPLCEKKEDYRKYFQRTSQQCLDIWQKKLHNIGRPILSMGMSDSFEIAIEEGATIVRVGRALFEKP